MENWQKIETFDSEAEARVVQSRLEAADVPTQLLGSHSRAAGLVPGQLRLMVRTEDLARASGILEPERAGDTVL